MPTIKPLARPGPFDQHFRLEELAAMGAPLAKIDDVADWSVFIPVLAEMPKPGPEGPGGRPSHDPPMVFKILIVQNLSNLSHAQAEFQITDRMSFKRFLGLSLADKSPDEKTIWAFHNYGYKNHVKVDSKSKLIEHFLVSEASLRDSQAIETLIRKGDPTTCADSAYAGAENERVSAENGVEARIIGRAYENKPLTKRQKARDKTKSRVRVGIEHVF